MMTRSQTNAYKVASAEAYNATASAEAYNATASAEAYKVASDEAYNTASSEASPVGVRRSPRFSEPVLRRSNRLNPQKEDSHRSVPVHLVSSVCGKQLEPRRSNRLNPQNKFVEPSVKMTIEEQEDDGVFIRRSSRLVSQPKCYVDPDDYFDLDNDSDDEDYNPKYDMEHDVYVSSDKRVRPRSIPFDVDEDIKFDFDEASCAWRQNKRSIGNGMFAYRTRSRSSSK